MLWSTGTSHHREILIYVLQIVMFILIKRGHCNYDLEKFHIHCQQFEFAQITQVQY
jgi:hypothetical protein